MCGVVVAVVVIHGVSKQQPIYFLASIVLLLRCYLRHGINRNRNLLESFHIDTLTNPNLNKSMFQHIDTLSLSDRNEA